MKKQLLALSLGFITFASFAQKSELRTAEKAIKKQNFTAAVAAVKSAESLIANADDKLKAKFYFVKGEAYAGIKDFKTAADAYNKLLAFEKQIGRERYSDDAKPLLKKMVGEVSNKAIALYNGKDYKNATENFYLTYTLSPKDTAFLYNAAVSAGNAGDTDLALKYYNQLKNLGYTSIKTEYFATDVDTNQEMNLGSKNQRDLFVKSGKYKNPVDKNSESKRGAIIKNIAIILAEKGEVDQAITTIQEARKMNPDDMSLLLTEADFYIKQNKMDEFGRLMEEAITKDPKNPDLYYNLGVINFNQGKVEKAKNYYKKAIELKPDYSDAYLNLAIAILSKEKAIVEEMNKNLSDFKKYDALEKQQKEVYKEALPYLEKADSLKRNPETVRTLMNMYQNLQMTEKAKKYTDLYKSMRQ